jgi:mannan endo-1,4-beta-mannosidase
VRTASRPGTVRTPRAKRTSRPIVGLLLAGLLGLLFGCSSSPTEQRPGGATNAGDPVKGESEETPVPFDVRPLLKPPRKYLGAALDGAPESLAPVSDFAQKIGKQPNLLEYYVAWGSGFDPQRVRNARAVGALPLMVWEPFEPSIAEIADGATDAYTRKFASAVRTLNLPMAISFGHEMNGNWYPWGTTATDPVDYVRAWQRIHDIFLDVGAANVIWVWSPNNINPVLQVPLKPFYPCDSYIDWIGVVGYYTDSGASTFPTLFGPTIAVVRKLTHKPILVVETASQPGPRKRKDVTDLFAGVAASPDVIGFIWFDYLKRADWRIGSDPAALAEFKRRAANDLFGFDVKHL